MTIIFVIITNFLILQFFMHSIFNVLVSNFGVGSGYPIFVQRVQRQTGDIRNGRPHDREVFQEDVSRN